MKYLKIKKNLAYIVLFTLLLTSFFIPISYTWADCPYGLVNDTYPGQCSRYIDTNNNGICDHSEPAPNDSVTVISENYEKGIIDIEGKVLKTKTLGFVCNYINLTENQCDEVIHILSEKLAEKNCNIYLDRNTVINNIVKTCDVTPSYIKGIFNGYYVLLNENKKVTNLQEKKTTINKNEYIKENFRLDDNTIYLILLVSITILYLISKYLVKTKKLRPLFVRKIWNWALLISFILLTISTIMMIFSIRIGNPLFLHKISGFAFLVLSIIHIWERKNYFIKI